ncbi:MAG: hypothetical protein ACLUW6_08590 [Coriobacteriaceae bacterium]
MVRLETGRELEAALAENALAETVPAEANSQTATRESDAADNSWRHVRMINMEDADAAEQARSCAMLVSRVFASAAFRGHQRSHRAMEDIIALAEAEGIPLINPGRAHHFEIDKRLAPKRCATRASRLSYHRMGTPAELGRAAADLDDSRSVALSRRSLRLGVP